MKTKEQKIYQKNRCPKHPGFILKTLYLEPLSISVTQFANIIGVSRKTVSAIVNEKKSVTPEMALPLARAFPNSTSESWINLQRNFDIWQVVNGTSDWQQIQPANDFLQKHKIAVS